ncbi:28S ribosomal protein S31, mitochondrial-like [Portunus trituberculatus]|uniref:28S ribosomal protein S31, mitochondrial-like n=1 Tax=Portunus trituberculatus TaxID=210409 RepID=UPI001E1CE91B|nr:28S ribosomal protein S31, mitochondrial-like [Portunus trituberculatus]
MAVLFRSPFIQALLPVSRLAAQPACLTRPLCRKPPEDGEQGGDARPATTVKNGDAEEKSLKSQNVETKIEDQKPLQEAEGEKTEESQLHVLKHESTVEEGVVAEKQGKKTSRQKKLHDLLSSLASVDPIPVEPQVQLSRPKTRRKAKAAAKDKPSPVADPNIEPELVLATKEVAKSLGGDVKETESELLSTLRLHSAETTTSSAPSLSELFVGMKVERKPRPGVEKVPPHLPSGNEISQGYDTDPRDQPRPRKPYTQLRDSSMPRAHVDLFGGEPLGIFKKGDKDTPGPATPVSVLPTWERLYQHELEQSMQHPPNNAFVEMIQWTNQGKLWTFPIDNEAGLVEEMKVGFHEHVFLERHLEGWCPKRGPIRHFMELVCTGLSKNPYLTVERKQAHIEWYKNYFSQKEDLLKELGAIEVS